MVEPAAESDEERKKHEEEERKNRDAELRKEIQDRMRMQELLEEEQERKRLGMSEEEFEKHKAQQKKLEALRRAAAVAGAAGAGAAAGARAVGRAAGSVARTGADAVSDISRSGQNAFTRVVPQGSGWYWLYLVLTLALHFFVFVPLASQTESTGYFILVYMVFAIFLIGTFAYLRRGSPDEVRSSLIATFVWLLLYLLPGLFQKYVGGDFTSAISYIVVYVPIWPLYMATKLEERTGSKLFKFIFGLYKFSIVLLVLFFAASALLDFGGPRFSNVNWGNPVDIVQGFWDFVQKFWDKVLAVFAGTGNYIDKATNPGAYYTGQIEETKQVPLGVEIESLRPIDPRITNESNVIVYGNVRARPMESNLFQRESVLIVPTCTIDTKDPPEATVDPISMDVVWGTYGQFQCEFPPLQTRKTYSIVGRVTFPFETWAYLPYTFVDEDRARNIARSGKDLRTELGIIETPQATYTSGPVTLGMGGTPQPIIVRPSQTTILADGARIGITLDSNWQNGKINHVTSLELKVPAPFSLVEASCDRKPTRVEQDPNDAEYTSYVFENPTIDKVTLYTSVTCKLAIDDREAAMMLVSSDTAVRSFIGRAVYEYSIQEKTSVRVE